MKYPRLTTPRFVGTWPLSPPGALSVAACSFAGTSALSLIGVWPPSPRFSGLYVGTYHVLILASDPASKNKLAKEILDVQMSTSYRCNY